MCLLPLCNVAAIPRRAQHCRADLDFAKCWSWDLDAGIFSLCRIEEAVGECFQRLKSNLLEMPCTIQTACTLFGNSRRFLGHPAAVLGRSPG
jgi:hypothetical protein